MKIKAKYRGTITKAVRANALIEVPCANPRNPKLVHQYSKDEIIGVSPTYHHYTFGKVGDDISGGFYIKTGTEVPDFIELCATEITVTLPDVTMTLKPTKGED